MFTSDLYGFLSDPYVFVLRVLERWQGYVTGGVLVALLAAAQWIWGYAPSRRTYINIFAIGFLFVAFFLVWREEYVKNKPALVGTILRTEFAKMDKGEFIVFPLLRVRNNRPIPIGIGNVSITYTSANGGLITKLKPFSFPGPWTLRYGDKGKRTFRFEDTLLAKMDKPIGANGGFIVGLVPFSLPSAEKDRLKGAQVTYCFEDMDSNRYCTTDTLTPLGKDFHGEIEVFPGERIE